MGIRLISVIYTTTENHTQLSSTEPVHVVEIPRFAVNLPLVTNIGYSRELTNLAKIYTENIKYSDHNNSFTFKLGIFDDIYSKADILFKAKMKAFFIMLKGLTLDYYYLNINSCIVTINFDQICHSIKNYFEKAEYK